MIGLSSIINDQSSGDNVKSYIFRINELTFSPIAYLCEGTGTSSRPAGRMRNRKREEGRKSEEDKEALVQVVQKFPESEHF